MMESMMMGKEIEYQGQKFVIVRIQQQDEMNGKSLVISACDADMANKIQQDQIKGQRLSDTQSEMLLKMFEQVKVMFEKGGGFPGFNIGG